MKTIILFFALLSFPVSVQAAEPKSVKYIEDVVTDAEEIYMHYVVNCTDGKTGDLSAWDNRKLWCIGKGTKNDSDCVKKQIKAAKQVCKSSS